MYVMFAGFKFIK